ncbi:glutamine amidotransferase-like class 1 domain-containing protein 1 isoform X2 [Myotis myotis]|nr:glutamine amidotransferase-like class 1 domain-containing protein 1 isoform X2 [Myotis myotis]
MDFVDMSESNARWVQDFRLKAYASPAKLESIDGEGPRPWRVGVWGSRCPVPCPPDSQLSRGPGRPGQQWVSGPNPAALPLREHHRNLRFEPEAAAPVFPGAGQRPPGGRPWRVGVLGEGQAPASRTSAPLLLLSEPICAVGHGVAALCCATNEDRSWVFRGYSVTGPSVYELVRAPGFARLPLIVEDFVKDAGASFSASEPDAVHVVLDRHLVTGQNAGSTVPAVQNLLFLCGSRK